jgi:hypothetical protein
MSKNSSSNGKGKVERKGKKARSGDFATESGNKYFCNPVGI